MDGAKESKRYIDVVLRTLDVLELFLTHEKLKLKDIYDLTGMQKNRIIRICGTLMSRGFLIFSKDEMTYSLGPLVSFLGHRFDRKNSSLAVIQNVLEQLSLETGETSHFCVRRGFCRFCLAIADGTKALRFAIEPGSVSPLNASASGKVLLAFLPEEEYGEILKDMPFVAVTSHSILDVKILRKQLDEIRRQGYAASFRENIPSGAGLAVPVFNKNNQIIGSLNLGGLAEDYENGKYVRYLPALREAACQLSTLCGGLQMQDLI
ncbi:MULTISPECIES: IclR family transcriptional regulator [unclassified Pyramidobacter]|uniref:IclR family transcriptional regulator n=1 Tax=unclassified Pyramidobacter TaxID=2632171 RepID=UPI000EA2A85C|nr:IclR family transcriptional regulator [Pyramidobacter sp. CG50-2]RKJ76088.1 IclR family transcriptional regulator [Pyramidobacter sp. CG50-2]